VKYDAFEDPEYWHFDATDFGKYDLPAYIDKITE
jgi:hypothetical protein